MTIKEAIVEYGVEHLAMGRKSRAWKYHARDVAGFFEESSELSEAFVAANVARYIGSLRERRNAPATMREKLGFIKALCRLSTEAGNPVSFPKRLTEGIVIDNARERVPSAAELKRLRAEMMPHDYEVIEGFLRTGLRSKEAALLRVADCHFGKGTAKIHETKTGRSRTIPMVGWFRGYCARAAKAKREYVFYLKGYDNYSCRIVAMEAWKQNVYRVARKRAGIVDLRIHDARHYATTELIERGADPMSVTTIMGWKNGSYIKRYTNLSMKSLQKTMALLNG